MTPDIKLIINTVQIQHAVTKTTSAVYKGHLFRPVLNEKSVTVLPSLLVSKSG